MTEAIYLTDSYLQTLVANVTKVEGQKVILDKTIFYAQGGGQPFDTGTITQNEVSYSVTSVKKENGEIVHEVDKLGIAPGKVELKIDWPRRYKLMRMHTAAHVVGTMVFKKGAQITGNQIGEEHTRFDFNLEAGLEKELLEQAVAEANEALARNMDIKVYELPREEAFKLPGIVKLADKLPPSVQVLRIVEIGDVDLQADGSTHVKNTREVGMIKVEKIENRGSANKRLYFTLLI